MQHDITARLLKERAHQKEQRLLQLSAEQQREEQRLLAQLQALREQLDAPLPTLMSILSLQCHTAQRLHWQQEHAQVQAALDELREARQELATQLRQAHLSQEQMGRLIERHKARLARLEQRREQLHQDDFAARRQPGQLRSSSL